MSAHETGRPDRSEPESTAQAADTVLSFADRLRAARDDQPEVRETFEKWVVFSVANHLLALPVTHVRELLRLSNLTVVPNAPDPVSGVINLRGHVLPVVDTHALLGLPRARATESSRVLVFLLAGRAVGLIVDEAHGLERIQVELIQALPEGEPLSHLARGTLPSADAAPITLLEPAKLFADGDPALN